MSNKEIEFSNFDDISEKLTSLAIEEALGLIKKNLNSLGINHDNFVSEKRLVQNQEVEKVIEYLQKNKFVYKGKIKAPASEMIITGSRENSYCLSQQILVMTKIEHYKNRMEPGHTLLSDVAYHKNKLDRNFDYLINILGADHVWLYKGFHLPSRLCQNQKGNLFVKLVN